MSNQTMKKIATVIAQNREKVVLVLVIAAGFMMVTILAILFVRAFPVSPIG